MGLRALGIAAAIPTMGPLLDGAPSISPRIEAYLDAATASVVKRVTAEGYSKGRTRALEMALLDGAPMLLRMELARGGWAGRFIGATRDNLRAAVECGAMSQTTFDAMWPAVGSRGGVARPFNGLIP